MFSDLNNISESIKWRKKCIVWIHQIIKKREFGNLQSDVKWRRKSKLRKVSVKVVWLSKLENTNVPSEGSWLFTKRLLFKCNRQLKTFDIVTKIILVPNHFYLLTFACEESRTWLHSRLTCPFPFYKFKKTNFKFRVYVVDCISKSIYFSNVCPNSKEVINNVTTSAYLF